MYSSETIDELNRLCSEYYYMCLEYQGRLILLSDKLSDGVKEHAKYGIARRLSTIRECVKFFFESMPPDLASELDSNVLAQGNAYLHAFLINCCGGGMTGLFTGKPVVGTGITGWVMIVYCGDILLILQ